MSGPNVKTFPVSEAILGAVASAIQAELTYQQATNCGRKFGITGEIGEILVCHRLGLKLVEDPRSKGFDAVDANGKCVQIKTRRGENSEFPSDAGRLSKFSAHECDYVLLAILSRDYKLVAIWRAEYAQLKPIIGKHKRSNPTIRQFKAVAQQIHPMRIAVFGWGSLVSNPNGDASIGQKPLKLAEGFRAGGPVLPLEFCRISKDGRLTLVIDAAHGKPCETFYAIAAESDLGSAIKNLAEREGSPTNSVHFALSNEKYGESIKDQIVAWCKRSGLTAAIWTGLRSKFDFRGAGFSVEAAISYLNSLDGVQRQKALDYIRTAPDTVNTPVREAAKSLIAQ